MRSSKWAVPGAQSRKRKAKSDQGDGGIQRYMAELQRQREEMYQQESANMENLVKMQQEAEDRRFKAMQEQQQANTQMVMQLMGTFMSALFPAQQPRPPTPNWIPPGPMMPPSTWPMTQPPNAPPSITHPPMANSFVPPRSMTQQPMGHPMFTEGEASTGSHGNSMPSTSSVLHDVNQSQHYHDL